MKIRGDRFATMAGSEKGSSFCYPCLPPNRWGKPGGFPTTRRMRPGGLVRVKAGATMPSCRATCGERVPNGPGGPSARCPAIFPGWLFDEVVFNSDGVAGGHPVADSLSLRRDSNHHAMAASGCGVNPQELAAFPRLVRNLFEMGQPQIRKRWLVGKEKGGRMRPPFPNSLKQYRAYSSSSNSSSSLSSSSMVSSS